MFKLCTIFIVNIPFCLDDSNIPKCAADFGASITDPTSAAAPGAAAAAADPLTVMIGQFKDQLGKRNIGMQLKLAYSIAADILTYIEVDEANMGVLTCKIILPGAGSGYQFEWLASQAQMACLINYCIVRAGGMEKEVAKQKLRANDEWIKSGTVVKWGNSIDVNQAVQKGEKELTPIKLTQPRNKVDVDEGLIGLFNHIIDYLLSVKAEPKCIYLSCIFLARIMKYMGDKSHAVGALVYNFISKKSFCVCTIDRPLSSTFIKINTSGNILRIQLSEDGTAVLVPDGKFISMLTGSITDPTFRHQLENVIRYLGGKDIQLKSRIYAALKNLSFAINPYMSASGILNYLPGFYGRYLKGVAQGAVNGPLLIYGPKFSSDDIIIEERKADLEKMIEIASDDSWISEWNTIIGSPNPIEVYRPTVKIDYTLPAVRDFLLKNDMENIFVTLGAGGDWKTITDLNNQYLLFKEHKDLTKSIVNIFAKPTLRCSC